MTKQDMVSQVQYWVGLQDVDAWDETALVNPFLYQGTIDLLARTRCVVRCVDLRVSAGVDEYTLDHSILGLVDVEDGHRRRARRDETAPTPDAVVIYPTGSVNTTPTTFTMIRSDIFRVAPVPDADGTVQTWAVLRPQQMVNDTDSVGLEQFGAIPDEFQDAIVTYALWKLSDYADDSGSGQGERYRALYEGQDGRGGRIAQIKIAVNKRGTARAPGRRVRLQGFVPRKAWIS